MMGIAHFSKAGLVLILMMAVIGGCSGDSGPQPIDEAVDVCASCNMSVSDGPFAAEWVQRDGEVLKFDDIGCLAGYLNNNDTDGEAYVRDFHSKEWIRTDQAFFAESEVHTPMDSGLVAFQGEDRLQAFIREETGAKETTWEEILRHARDEEAKH
jgi:copper chaperone NosL